MHEAKQTPKPSRRQPQHLGDDRTLVFRRSWYHCPMVAILYIDGADDRMDWLTALAKEGFTVLGAKSAEEALKTLGNTPGVGVILLDHDSSDINPITFIPAVEQHASGPRPEVTIFSHREDLAKRAKFYKAGIDDIISKGMAMREIFGRLRATAARAERLHMLFGSWRNAAAAQVVDEETGYFNLRYLRLRTREEVARSNREERPVSIMMLELMSIAEIRTECGAEIASEAMKKLAQRIRDSVRNYDILCRTSPNQLAVLLPGVEPITSYSLAKRLLEKLREEPITVHTLDDTIVRETRFAVGLAGLTGDEADSNPSSLLAAAEHAVADAIGDGANTIGFVTVEDPGKEVIRSDDEVNRTLPEIRGVQLESHNLPLSGETGENFPAVPPTSGDDLSTE